MADLNAYLAMLAKKQAQASQLNRLASPSALMSFEGAMNMQPQFNEEAQVLGRAASDLQSGAIRDGGLAWKPTFSDWEVQKQFLSETVAPMEVEREIRQGIPLKYLYELFASANQSPPIVLDRNPIEDAYYQMQQMGKYK